jgi:hypothetical protein
MSGASSKDCLLPRFLDSRLITVLFRIASLFLSAAFKTPPDKVALTPHRATHPAGS